jgi:hypothetical protein
MRRSRRATVLQPGDHPGGALRPAGRSALPLRDLLDVLPEAAVLSVEVPMNGSTPPEQHVREIFTATQELFAACRTSTGGN